MNNFRSDSDFLMFSEGEHLQFYYYMGGGEKKAISMHASV